MEWTPEHPIAAGKTKSIIRDLSRGYSIRLWNDKELCCDVMCCILEDISLLDRLPYSRRSLYFLFELFHHVELPRWLSDSFHVKQIQILYRSTKHATRATRQRESRIIQHEDTHTKSPRNGGWERQHFFGEQSIILSNFGVSLPSRTETSYVTTLQSMAMLLRS